jgi:hypothetical protein
LYNLPLPPSPAISILPCFVGNPISPAPPPPEPQSSSPPDGSSPPILPKQPMSFKLSTPLFPVITVVKEGLDFL